MHGKTQKIEMVRFPPVYQEIFTNSLQLCSSFTYNSNIYNLEARNIKLEVAWQI